MVFAAADIYRCRIGLKGYRIVQISFSTCGLIWIRRNRAQVRSVGIRTSSETSSLIFQTNKNIVFPLTFKTFVIGRTFCHQIAGFQANETSPTSFQNVSFYFCISNFKNLCGEWSNKLQTIHGLWPFLNFCFSLWFVKAEREYFPPQFWSQIWQ